jgi:hypothetical protein
LPKIWDKVYVKGLLSLAINWANNISQTRAKVLIAAFTRSIRDPFVHARNAGLLALAATMEYFSEDDCASKILPALCPVLLDKERQDASLNFQGIH